MDDRVRTNCHYRDHDAVEPRVAVCHITTVHQPFDTRVFHKECVSLAQAGYDVHLIACHVRDEIVDGVRIHALPMPHGRLRRMLSWPWLALDVAQRIRPRPALYHLHDPELLPVAQTLRLRGQQVVFDVHENIAEDILCKPYLPLPARIAVSWAYRFAEKLLTSGLPTVHVLEEIARLYRPPRVVVRNLPRREGPIEPLDQVARAPGGRLRLIYVGVISTDRGAITMLDMLRLLLKGGADSELMIIGPTHESGPRDRLVQAAQVDELAGRVLLPGPLPYHRVLSELRAADVGLCLLHPQGNHTRSLPTKVLEYMWAGLPVVASDFPIWRPLVADTAAGLMVPAADAQAAAKAVRYMLDRPAERQRMGDLGRQAIETRFCWEVEQENLLGLYRRLAGPPEPAGRPGKCISSRL